MFSNLEVESNIAEEQEFQNINSPREMADDNYSVDTSRPQNSNNQSNNTVGNGVITVNI